MVLHAMSCAQGVYKPEPLPTRAPDGRYLPPYGHRHEINDNWFEDYGADVKLSGTQCAYVDGTFQAELPVGEVYVEAARGSPVQRLDHCRYSRPLSESRDRAPRSAHIAGVREGRSRRGVRRGDRSGAAEAAHPRTSSLAPRGCIPARQLKPVIRSWALGLANRSRLADRSRLRIALARSIGMAWRMSRPPDRGRPHHASRRRHVCTRASGGGPSPPRGWRNTRPLRDRLLGGRHPAVRILWNVFALKRISFGE